MKKRLLFINGHLNAGGVERSLVDVLRHLDFQQYDVNLILLEGTGDYFSELPPQIKTKVYRLQESDGAFFPTIINLLKDHKWSLFIYRIALGLCSLWGKRWLCILRPFIKEARIKYDSVIAYRPDNPTYFAAYVFQGVTKISWWHNGEINFSGKTEEEHLKAYKCFDFIVAVSECTSRLLKNHFPAISEKVKIIPNMLCAEGIRYKADLYTPSLPGDCFNIVTVCRFSPEKNLSLCVQTSNRLREEGIRFHWTIIGDGIEFKNIAALIQKFNLKEFITCTGRLENPYPYIKHADLLFHSSLVESQGLVILEALAVGTQVIAVESEGPKEFIHNRENGILIPPTIEDSFRSIMEILSNKVTLSVGDTVDFYSPEIIMERISEIITK